MMRTLKHVIRTCLNKGLHPEDIALAVALGILMGVFPIYIPVSLLCLGAAWLTRLSGPILLAGVYTMTWVKPLLIVPFLRLGEWICGAEPLGISLVELFRRFAEAPLGTVGEFAWSFLHALVGWLVVLPILIPVLQRFCLMLLKRVALFQTSSLSEDH